MDNFIKTIIYTLIIFVFGLFTINPEGMPLLMIIGWMSYIFYVVSETIYEWVINGN